LGSCPLIGLLVHVNVLFAQPELIENVRTFYAFLLMVLNFQLPMDQGCPPYAIGCDMQ
jgi:hypothetical protein